MNKIENFKINKKDMLMLIMDYLREEGFDRSYISLEEESKVNLYNYEERLVILRKSILDGEWDELENFLEQFKKIENFPYLSLLFEIRKEKLIEDVESQQNENTLEELAQELKEIQSLGQNDKFNELIEYLKESSNHDEVNNIISRRLNIFMMIRENMKFMHPVCDNEVILKPGSLNFLISNLIENCIRNNNNINIHNKKEYSFNELISILKDNQNNNNNFQHNNINNNNINVNNVNINSKINIDSSNNELEEEEEDIFNFDKKENKVNSQNININSINKNNKKYMYSNNNNNNNYKNVNYQIEAFQEKNEISTTSQKIYKTNLERLADTYDDLDLNIQIQDNSSSLTPSKIPSKNLNDLSDLDQEEYYMKNCYDYYNYDITSLSLKKVIEDTHPIRCCCFSPKGEYFAIGTNSKSLKIYDLSYILDNFTKRNNIYSQLSSNNATSLLSNSKLNKETIGMVLEQKNHHHGSIFSIDWSPSGKLLATGSNDKTIKLMNIPELDEKNNKSLTGNQGTVRSLCFEPTNDSILLSANTGESTIKLWDTMKGINLVCLEGHNSDVNVVKWSNDLQLFASSSFDKTIRFWDIRDYKYINILSSVQYADINDISIFSKGGDTIVAVGHADGLVTIWDYSKQCVIKEIYQHNQAVRSVAFSPDGKYLLSGSFDSTIKIYDINNNFNNIGKLEHGDKVVQCKWHPEIPLIVSTSADKTARVWVPSKF